MSEPGSAPTPEGVPAQRRVAFVLGGGGDLGANEVGMLRALLERGILPDLVVGASVGAMNGAAVAAEPTAAMVARLEAAWRQLGSEGVLDSPWQVAGNVIRGRSHLHSNLRLRAVVERMLPVTTFEQLAVPFQCVAASIERAAEHWFSAGPLVDAILASAAVPGLLPVVEVGGEHFLDGGIVNSIPVSRALALGATEVFVLQVGRIERTLQVPRNLYQVMTVAFEIARRHRFAHDIAALPEGIVAHVLPTGDEDPGGGVGLRTWDLAAVDHRIARAYATTSDYLDRLAKG
ncbi:MAG: patatin-like phospholipase family protein [Actinomycetota bacterium]